VDNDDFSNLPLLIDVETFESEQSDCESPSCNNEELPEFDIPLLPTCETDSDDDNGSAGPLFCGVLSCGAEPPDVRALERSSTRPKGTSRLLPKPIVILVYLNHKLCHALLDCGSLTDFVSITLVDQLKLKYSILEKPIPLQLAISGSWSSVKATSCATFAYQDISEECTFNIANLDLYDIILGMPFLYQHQVLLRFNPSELKIQSIEALPICGAETQVLEVRSAGPGDEELEAYRKELCNYASDICKEAIETPLPPLHAINHIIPLVDESVTYQWHQSRCPEALCPLWRAKHDDYIRTGHWEFFSGTNAILMLMLQKPSKDGTLHLQTVLDT